MSLYGKFSDPKVEITPIKTTGRNLQEEPSQPVRAPEPISVRQTAPPVATQNNQNGYANGHQRKCYISSQSNLVQPIFENALYRTYIYGTFCSF